MSAASLKQKNRLPSESARLDNHQKPSLRRNFGWALLGNVIYQGSQWLNLVILAKVLSADDVGQFALALAICTPISTFSALNLRSVQVTDAGNQHRFGDFLAVQLICSVLSIAIIAAIPFFYGYSIDLASLVIVVGIGQAIVTIRSVFIAFNQKHERMKSVTVSETLLGISSLFALGGTVWATGSLISGVVAAQVAKLAVFLFWDLQATSKLVRTYFGQQARAFLRPSWNLRTIITLAWFAVPLGITSVLAALIKSVPRYYIDAFYDRSALGYFAVVASLVEAGNLITAAAGLSALPRLSRYFIEDRPAYLRLLGKLTASGAIMGLLGLVTVMLFGKQILSMLFNANYANYDQLLVWMMVYGLLTFTFTFLNYGLHAARQFKSQPPIFLAALASTAVAGWVLIPPGGLIGAAISMIIGRTVHGIGILFWLYQIIKNQRSGNLPVAQAG